MNHYLDFYKGYCSGSSATNVQASKVMLKILSSQYAEGTSTETSFDVRGINPDINALTLPWSLELHFGLCRAMLVGTGFGNLMRDIATAL